MERADSPTLLTRLIRESRVTGHAALPDLALGRDAPCPAARRRAVSGAGRRRVRERSRRLRPRPGPDSRRPARGHVPRNVAALVDPPAQHPRDLATALGL